MKRIIFLLPGHGKGPVGGYKVVYEYANRLVDNGYNVDIIYPAYCFSNNKKIIYTAVRMFKAILIFLYYGITKKYSCKKWFSLNDGVNERWVWSLAHSLPISDSYIATAMQTAIYLQNHNEIPSLKKIYLIQDFENWNGVTIQEVLNTYHFPFRKIVISKWIEKIVNDAGEKCVLIPNGFDFNYFRKTTEITSRNRFTVCMLYHLSERKGCNDGFRALNIVKLKYPNLKVNIFGVPPRPKDLPDWYHYYQQPNREIHNRLYNESAIFIGTSWSEGWGLTIGEAMICGAAIACTDTLGYKEMAIEGKTALISPIKNAEALAENIIYLIEHDDERYRIADAGNKYIKQFTWESAYKKFITVL